MGDCENSLAEKLPEGDYRHLVVTLPKKMGLRKRFQLDTRLHRQIGRLVQRVINRWMAKQIGCHRNRREERDQAKPAIIMAVQSFGAGPPELQISSRHPSAPLPTA